MSAPHGSVPQRIGDAERDRAADCLREHLAVGRLDPVEFDERLTQALNARLSTEIDPLFTDLPDPKPSTELVPTSFTAPPWQSRPTPSTTPVPAPDSAVAQGHSHNQIWARASAVAWPLAIIACFITDWNYWWILMIPIFLPWIIGALTGEEKPGKGGRRH